MQISLKKNISCNCLKIRCDEKSYKVLKFWRELNKGPAKHVINHFFDSDESAFICGYQLLFLQSRAALSWAGEQCWIEQQMQVSIHVNVEPVLFRSLHPKFKFFVNRLHGVLNIVEK